MAVKFVQSFEKVPCITVKFYVCFRGSEAYSVQQD